MDRRGKVKLLKGIVNERELVTSISEVNGFIKDWPEVGGMDG